MNSKQNSTIAAKPKIDPALQWIGVAEVEKPASTSSRQANKQTKQHVDKQTSKQANKNTKGLTTITEDETTAMLSARVPASLIRELRIRAATEGRPIQEIITELLRDYLRQS